MIRVLMSAALALTLGLTFAVQGAAEPAVAPAAVAPAHEEEAMAAPVAISVKAEEIAQAFESAPWVGKPGQTGPVLYVIGFRSCPTCNAFKAAEQERLLAAGVDVRWILYARKDRDGKQRSKPGERAMAAELWLTRSYDDFLRWYAKAPASFYAEDPLPPAAESDPARMAAVAAGRALVDRLDALYAENGLDFAIPTLLWRQDGRWMTYIGYSADGFAPARDYLLGAAAARPAG